MTGLKELLAAVMEYSQVEDIAKRYINEMEQHMDSFIRDTPRINPYETKREMLRFLRGETK